MHFAPDALRAFWTVVRACVLIQVSSTREMGEAAVVKVRPRKAVLRTLAWASSDTVITDDRKN